MKFWIIQALFALGIITSLTAQQQVTIISECGGWDTITIPNIIDNDLDGMDDALEQMLLDRFMPYITQYDNDNCPGPNTNGSGDTCLVVSRIFPVPQQYTRTNSIDSVKLNPTPIVPARGLTVGLVWYNTVVKVNSALLYGKDCGALGHTADVEGFNFSLQYVGQLPGGWMYDTDMQQWMGGKIQTVSHAGTLCESIQTYPYRSSANPAGKDTIYPSKNKHGSYLTVSQCNSNFICDPGCSGSFTRKEIKNVNLGEPNAQLVTDLGTIYPPYAGENPWGNADFLNGGAGTVKSKMNLELNNTFIQGSALASQAVICNMYRSCFGTSGSAILTYTCAGTPYNFYNQQLTTAGVYTETIQTSYGCDSVVTLTLSIVQPDTVTITKGLCSGGSYTFDGQQLTTSGTYQATFTNSGGCDSLVTLNLSIGTSISITLNEHICDGEIYVHQGQNLTTTGIYADTFSAAGGCDSIVTLELQVDSVPTKPIVMSNNTLLNTDSDTNLTYQWYLDGALIPGSNTPSYNAPVDGYYQVLVSNANGCSTSSDSLFVSTLGTGINGVSTSAISLYPNPAASVINVVLPTTETVTIAIYNVSGQMVLQHQAQGATKLNIETLAPGLYFVRVNSSFHKLSGKFIKQ